MNPGNGLKLFLLLAGLLVSTTSPADPFVGRFEGEIDGKRYELSVYSDAPGVYDGELRAADSRLPVFGQRFGEFLMGKIGFPDDQFAFRGRVMGAVLVLERQAGSPLRFIRVSD